MKQIIFIITLILSGLLVKAQIPQPDPDTTARHFLIVASIKNLQEISAGTLAIEKATLADVKKFGQMMIKDHHEAEQKILQVAKSKNIDLPSASTGIVQSDLMLENAGSNFDRLYVHNMVSSHQNTVEVFKTYATTGKDPEIKALAQNMLPLLKAHLQEILKIEVQLKRSATK